jgi:hypothetical protein
LWWSFPKAFRKALGKGFRKAFRKALRNGSQRIGSVGPRGARADYSPKVNDVFSIDSTGRGA